MNAGKGIGSRKPKDMPVIFVRDKLKATRSVKQAAEELGCSRGYVYEVLKAAGLGVRKTMMIGTNLAICQDGSFGDLLENRTRTEPEGR